jgi:hypothetical protein
LKGKVLDRKNDRTIARSNLQDWKKVKWFEGKDMVRRTSGDFGWNNDRNGKGSDIPTMAF